MTDPLRLPGGSDALDQLRLVERLGGPCRDFGPSIIEVSTTGYDPLREGIGSTWMPGSPHASRLQIPVAPTTVPNNRYTFALCGVNVPKGASARIIGYRQKLIIGTTFNQAQGQGTVVIEKEIPITTPDWSFPDGNVAWCFRFLPGERQVPRLGDTGTSPLNAGPSRTKNPYGAFSALIYRDNISGTYNAPAGGQPPGFAIDGISTLYDVRNPWTAPNPTLSTLLHGPGDIIMYASVWQTNPAGRPVWAPPPGFDVGAVAPEDRFVLAFPQTKYAYVAGAMILEVS